MPRLWVAAGVTLGVLVVALGVAQRRSHPLSDTELAAKVLPGAVFRISCRADEGALRGKPYNRVCRVAALGRDVAWLEVDGADYCVVQAVASAEGRRC
jgi:hypothetical protein